MKARRSTFSARQAARARSRNRPAHLAMALLLLPVAAFLAWAIAHCIANPPPAMPAQQFVCSLGVLATMGLAALILGAANLWECR